MTPADNPAPTPREAVFTLKRAAEVAGVSASTLRRNKELLREHGATVSEHGWQVPMSALVASGLMRRTTPPDQPASAPGGADAPAGDDDRERIRDLERELLEARHRAEVDALLRRAEVAEAKVRLLDRALGIAEQKMLTTGPVTTATSAPEAGDQGAGAPEPQPDRERPAQEHTAPRTWLDRLLMRGPNR